MVDDHAIHREDIEAKRLLHEISLHIPASDKKIESEYILSLGSSILFIDDLQRVPISILKSLEPEDYAVLGVVVECPFVRVSLCL